MHQFISFMIWQRGQKMQLGLLLPNYSSQLARAWLSSRRKLPSEGWFSFQTIHQNELTYYLMDSLTECYSIPIKSYWEISLQGSLKLEVSKLQVTISERREQPICTWKIIGQSFKYLPIQAMLILRLPSHTWTLTLSLVMSICKINKHVSRKEQESGRLRPIRKLARPFRFNPSRISLKKYLMLIICITFSKFKELDRAAPVNLSDFISSIFY